MFFYFIYYYLLAILTAVYVPLAAKQVVVSDGLHLRRERVDYARDALERDEVVLLEELPKVLTVRLRSEMYLRVSNRMLKTAIRIHSAATRFR